MTFPRFSWRKGVAGLALVGLLAGSLVGCNGPTTLDTGQLSGGKYNVQISMDPQLVRPPQLVTLSYSITDSSTGKPVTDYQPVAGALMHNVLISHDLTRFKHTYTDRAVLDSFSLLTVFPQASKYYSFAVFQPTGGELQILTSTIQTGGAGAEPALVADSDASQPDSYRPKTAQGVRFDLYLGSGPVKAGQPTQLVLYPTERGNPIIGLWPFLGAPGYMWAISQEGKDFAFETGVSPQRQLLPTATASPGASGSPVMAGTAVAAGTPGSSPPGGLSENATAAVPTLAPNVQYGFATRTAQPLPTLIPVQETAQASILETPVVQPSIGYGPYVVFTHTFPEPGLYKVWFETQYRSQVLTVDYVVRVEK